MTPPGSALDTLRREFARRLLCGVTTQPRIWHKAPMIEFWWKDYLAKETGILLRAPAKDAVAFATLILAELAVLRQPARKPAAKEAVARKAAVA